MAVPGSTLDHVTGVFISCEEDAGLIRPEGSQSRIRGAGPAPREVGRSRALEDAQNLDELHQVTAVLAQGELRNFLRNRELVR